MRTIETTVYEFDELTQDAKQKAIDLMREQCYCANCEWTWDDANETIKVLEETAGVRCNIQESSQGFYVQNAFRRGDVDYDLTDKQEFDKFRKRYIEQFKEDLWCDNIMLNIVQTYQYCDRMCYESNVGRMLVKFCEWINDDCLTYFKDENVEEWICGQDFEFTEDGRVYHE